MHNKLFIDGEWIAASNGAMLDVINPANEEVFHQVAAGTTADITAVVEAARRAFDKGPWSRVSGAQRLPQSLQNDLLQQMQIPHSWERTKAYNQSQINSTIGHAAAALILP